MFKLVLLSLQVAVILCVPAQEGAKSDTGADDEQPQNDGYMAYSTYNRRRALLMDRMNAIRNSDMFREVGRYTSGTKGQTNLMREIGAYAVGSKGQTVLREISEPLPLASCSLIQHDLTNLRAKYSDLQLANNNLMEQNIKLNKDILLLSSSVDLREVMPITRCPVGYYRFANKCYKYETEKRTWKSAQEHCMKERGNLASINSKEEQEFITDMLKRVGANLYDAYAYVGARDVSVEGIWKWVGSEQSIIYPTYWVPGFPRGYGPADDCMSMYLTGTSTNVGRWTDIDCRRYLPSVCEIGL